MLLEPIGVSRWPGARSVLLDRRPVEIELHQVNAASSLNAHSHVGVQVTLLEDVESHDFFGEHFHFFLLQVGQLLLQIDHLLFLDSFGDHLPLLFELEALVVVLDAPLLPALVHLSSSWFSLDFFFGGFLRLRREVGDSMRCELELFLIDWATCRKDGPLAVLDLG